MAYEQARQRAACARERTGPQPVPLGGAMAARSPFGEGWDRGGRIGEQQKAGALARRHTDADREEYKDDLTRALLQPEAHLPARNLAPAGRGVCACACCAVLCCFL